MTDNQAECPKCGCTQITANKKGFSLGNAALGGILLGPVGLLGGFVDSNIVKATCLKCGYSWRPGNLSAMDKYYQQERERKEKLSEELKNIHERASEELKKIHERARKKLKQK